MTEFRIIRRQLGLSQIELAAQLGVAQPTISRFENGAQTLDPRTRLALEALIWRKKMQDGGKAAEHAPTDTSATVTASSGKSGEFAGQQEKAA